MVSHTNQSVNLEYSPASITLRENTVSKSLNSTAFCTAERGPDTNVPSFIMSFSWSVRLVRIVDKSLFVFNASKAKVILKTPKILWIVMLMMMFRAVRVVVLVWIFLHVL